MIRPTLTYLNTDEYNQGFCYYPFMVNLAICNWSCNTLDDTSDRICVPNKTEDVNLDVLNMIKRIMNQKHQQNIYHRNL